MAYLHHLVEKVSYHACKMQIVQALNPQDYNCRLAFVRDGEKVNNVWAHLCLSGFINKQNLSYCYEINPNSLYENLSILKMLQLSAQCHLTLLFEDE